MALSLKQKIGFSLVGVYLLGSTGAAVYYYDLARVYESKVPQSEKEIEKEIAMILPEIKKIMDVPNEKPTIATVKDKASLKGQQQFFAKAENGDKLLVFPTARKAVLYRPSQKRIIESGPIVVDPQQQTQQSGLNQVQPVKVVIYNGTNVKDAAKDVETKLKQAAGALINLTQDEAKLKTYKTSIVVDLTGKNAQSVADVAKLIGGQVGELPAGETKPEADILIIVGGVAQ